MSEDEDHVPEKPHQRQTPTGLPLPELSKRFALLKAMREHHEKIVDTLGKELSAIGEELYKDFANAGAAQLVVSGVLFQDKQDRIVTPEVKLKPHVANQDLFFDFLRTTGSGALIRETVHHATLEKWCTEQKENNRPLPAEDVLRIFTLETAKVRRRPKARQKG